MLRPLVFAILALAAGITAAAAQTSPPQRRDPPTQPATATPIEAQPNIAEWMSHAVDNILTGKTPAEGRSSAEGK